MNLTDIEKLFFSKCKNYFHNSNINKKFYKKIIYLKTNLPKEDIEKNICSLIYEESFECFIHYFNNYYNDNNLSYSDKWKSYIKMTNFTFIFKKYNNLKRDIILRIKEYLDQKNKILKLYKQDKLKISNSIKKDLGKLIYIKSNMGDKHNGDTVSLLIFSNGKLIYKPQKYNQFILLKKLLNFFNSKSEKKINFLIPKVVYYQNHSWIEYIKNKNLDTQNLQNFFYESGVYLSIFYILFSTDLHMENMLINNNHPVFIDLETLMTYSKVNRNNNILNSGFLPISKNMSMDITISSLFRPLYEKSNNLFSYEICFDDKYGFRYLKKNIKKFKETENSKLLFGNKKCLLSLIMGFKKSLYIMKKNKYELLKIIDNIFQNNSFNFRVVLRNSEVYSEFIDGIKNPNTRLKNNEDKILNLFLNNNFNGVSKDEIKNLRRGWIPSYYISSSNNDLLNSNYKTIQKNYFKNSLLYSLKNRVYELKCKDIIKQKHIIKLSYLKTHIFYYKNNNLRLIQIEHSLNYFIKNIYNISSNSDDTLNYYGIKILKDYTLDYGGICPGIYNTSGWVLLLYYYGKKMMNIEYIKIAIILLKELVKRLKKTNKKSDNSLLTGHLGTYYIYVYINNFEKLNFSIDKNNLQKSLNYSEKLLMSKINNLDKDSLISNLIKKINDNNKYPNQINNETMSPFLSGALNTFVKTYIREKDD